MFYPCIFHFVQFIVDEFLHQGAVDEPHEGDGSQYTDEWQYITGDEPFSQIDKTVEKRTVVRNE